MTAEEVIALFAPPSFRVEAVVSWLTDAGISSERISHSANKQVSPHATLIPISDPYNPGSSA
jgi:hypothetical protein